MNGCGGVGWLVLGEHNSTGFYVSEWFSPRARE